MTNIVLNDELKGIELYFDSKPIQNIIDSLKNVGYRWHNFKKCWYAKQNERTLTEAKKFSKIEAESITESIIPVVKKEKINLSLWDRVRFTEGTEDTTKYNYKYVGSNYTGISTKETAVIIRKHLKERFQEIKFSITSDYNKIDVSIKESPYNNSKLEYSPELRPIEYRDYEEENNKELNAIIQYCNDLLSSYNFDDSDTMTDYFHKHFYKHVTIDYKYNQTEQTESIKNDITDFRNKLQAQAQEEEKRRELEYQERQKQQEEDNKQYKIRAEQEKKEIEIINNSITVNELEEKKQYFVINVKMANLNKNNTLEQYQEEVLKGDYYLNNLKVTREIHFTSQQALNYFSNMLLNDFEFLQNSGGCFTDDKRINSMIDYHNMTKEEQKTVIFNLSGIAIYYNNELKFVVDTQGYSYARYVGLTDNVTIQKEFITEQGLTGEQIQEYKNKAEVLTDISVDIITENNLINTWNTDNLTQYKELMKEQLKKYNIKLSKEIIQQITEDNESLKIVMYKLLTQVDGIQEQFKNADLQQGQKLTLFYISDWGSIAENRITLDKINYTKYAQYDNAVKITYTPQGKRKQYYNHFYSTLLVYSGWLELPETVLHDVESRNGMTISTTKYLSCDKKQYDDILNHFGSQGIKPVVNTYKPSF